MAISLVEVGPYLFVEVKDLIMFMQGELATEPFFLLSIEFIFLG